jgi:tetraprenyl-beta-curcumene synthase
MTAEHTHHLRDLAALLRAGGSYWLTIYPRSRREIRRWCRRAQRIPDPTLRGHALDKFTREHLNPEAAAFFAILAPRRHRARVVRLIVAYQIAYDYLDAVNEQPATAALDNGLQLHRALADAAGARMPAGDYYRHHPHSDDGGYLAALVAECRAVLRRLPSAAAVEPLLVRAAERCAEAQSRNHASRAHGQTQLVEWTARLEIPHYLWWELAAGGISCLGLHALFAAAAAARTGGAASDVDAAYFPSVCAISALLDSLIDRSCDLATANHNFTSHYATSTQAAARFAAISSEADERLGTLPGARRHRLILAGVVAFYLSAHEAGSEFARPVRRRTLEGIGPIATVMLLTVRLMRRRR